MCIHDAEDFHSCDARPIQPAVGLARILVLVGHEEQTIGMPNIHGNLSGAVAGEFVGAGLRQQTQDSQVVRRHELRQPLANAPAVVGPVIPRDGFLVRQYLGELSVGKREFQASP